MTVKELIEQLKEVDQDRIVVMSRDPEGNGFSPLSGVETCAYSEDNGYGETGLEPDDLNDELREQGYTEEDISDGQPAVCLWPDH